MYLVTLTSIELVDSFQWLLLLKSSVPCTVLEAVREYAMISFLVTLICLGIHLCIIMIHPKCLKVIKEEKQRRNTLLQRSYIFATFTIPVLFVPWPFMDMEFEYGRDGYLCWLTYNCNASDSILSYLLSRLLMWDFWVYLTWMFTIAVLVLAMYCYCRPKLNGTISKPNHKVCTLIALLLTFVIYITVYVAVLIWSLTGRKFSLPIAVLAVVFPPLMLVVNVLVIIIRQARIKVSKRNESAINTNASTFIAAKDVSYGATHFTLPDDEWN